MARRFLLEFTELSRKMNKWREHDGQLKCKPLELNLKITLTGGQSFRWKSSKLNSSNEELLGVMRGHLWILSQTDDHLVYKVFTNDEVFVENKNCLSEYYEQILRQYFRLDTNLEECYKKWRESHDHFKQSAVQFNAIRVLNQEPLENIMSFICSQNNHINRISCMVEKLCTDYGEKICSYNGVDYYAFPALEDLTVSDLEQNLRDAKFGYRAAYISKAIKKINDKGGTAWLDSLKLLPYKQAKQELLSIPGIGPKVADCICLMSLGHLDAVPVDTHIYKVASQHYLPNLKKTKTVTNKVYEEIGNTFRSVYGPLAGWAQTIIFCSDLERFKTADSNADDIDLSRKRKKC